MALADRIKDGPKRRPSGMPCSVGELEERLKGTTEGDALHAMLYELGWSQERIYADLRAEGHDVGKQTINRHRARACRCFL
jgi:hypothetical protein